MNGEAAHEAGSEVHGAGAPGAPGSQREPSEEELRAAYEAELSRLTSADVMVNACVTLLSIGGRRLGGPAGEEPQGAGAAGEAGARDLEQVREAIDGARALLGVLERRLGKERNNNNAPATEENPRCVGPIGRAPVLKSWTCMEKTSSVANCRRGAKPLSAGSIRRAARS